MPDYGAKQGALSVSLLVLGEDSGWTGHTAVLDCSALDTQASSKTAGTGVHVFVSVLMFVFLESVSLFGSSMCTRIQLWICTFKHATVCTKGNGPLITTFPLCDEGQPSVIWGLELVTYPNFPWGWSSVMRGHYHWRVHCTGDKPRLQGTSTVHSHHPATDTWCL